jgi:hypothetical protein
VIDGVEELEGGGSVESGAQPMQMRSPRYGWVLRGASAVLVGTVFLAFSGSAAWAWPNCTSDRRATAAYGRDPRSCWAMGLRGDTRVGSRSGSSAGDANVTGTVQTNVGRVQPGTGQEFDVAITGPSPIVVDAVVVGGYDRYNTYRLPWLLPPRLEPDQHYIAPLSNGFKVPTISYWFACYHVEPGTALPEVPQALDVPVAGGVIFAAWWLVHRKRRKELPAS